MPNEFEELKEENEMLKQRIEDLEIFVRQFNKIDRYTVEKLIQLQDGRDIQVGRETGSTFGTDTDQKVGFHGSKAVQDSAIADPSGAGTAGVDQPARDAVISILSALRSKGIIAT